MAKELVHKTVGTALSQAEFEDVALHTINSQSTGDIIYATSSTQLTGLPIGASNAVLQVIGGVPTWQASLTVSGDIDLSSRKLTGTNEGYAIGDDSHFASTVNTRDVSGWSTLQWGASGTIQGSGAANTAPLTIKTGTGAAQTSRLAIGAGSVSVEATWTTTTHSGFAITDGQAITVGTVSGCQIATASTQKLGFYGATPVVQPSAPTAAVCSASPSVAIATIRDQLVNLGILKA